MVAVARFTTIMKNAKKKHAIEERWIGFRISENPEYQSHSRYQEKADENLLFHLNTFSRAC